MNAQPLPPSPGKARARPPPNLALVVSSASAMLAGLAVGYALGTVHAYERQLARGDHHGV
jgi:purine-cytosine permease-like protein